MKYYDEAFAVDFIEAARACLGTPFHHQGRLAGVGLDCGGLVVVASRAAGHTPIDSPVYLRMPLGADMLATLHAQCEPVPLGQEKPGDLLLMKFAGNPQHIGILTGFSAGGARQVIHAYEPAGRVIEQDMSPALARHLFGVFRIIKKGA